jgi:peptidoglycan/xylan/chitin deacetylase (PgdA/CDA1 family)
MSLHSKALIKATLSALYYSGAGRLLSPLTRGAGVIFMLHHVRPEPPQEFEPNRILKVTPDFLDGVISHVLEAGFEVLALDQVRTRLGEEGGRPFACFTFDDGYRDNREFAYPLFKKHGVPFTVYIPTDFADGKGDLWWLVLERILRQAYEVEVPMDGETRRFQTVSTAEKYAAFDTIYWWLRGLPELEARAVVADLAKQNGFDAEGLCTELAMSWDEIRALAADPLVTIGAHTRRHLALGKLSVVEACEEMDLSIRRVTAELGRPCRHFCYPYGCEASAGEREFALARELGIETAVTTRKGLLYPGHAENMTALPRLSLNGDFQDRRYVEVMLSGAPFALLNAVHRVAGA